MDGLYTSPSEDSFKSDEQIKRELYLNGHHPEPDFVTPFSEPRDFKYWSTRFRQRQEESPISVADIQFFESPLISFQSDLHIGGQETDYERIEREAEIIVNSKSYVILMGDLIDNFSFNPPQHDTQEAVPQQIQYAKSLIKYYADNGRLLAVWKGNHDHWTNRQGMDLYSYLLDGIQTYYFFGEGYIRMKANDEEWRMTGNHQFKGHSQFNNTHGQNRAVRFGGAFGSDIVVSGHWHEKGIAQQPFYEFGGESRIATLIALGSYKRNDEYLRNNGFPTRDSRALYGASVLLSDTTHTLIPFYDIIEAHKHIKY